jgi:hypothetical protein
MRDSGRGPVKKRLEALGFQVDDVAENPKQKRPDLCASKDGTTMFVEVKTRTEDAELRARMESVGVGTTESIRVSLDKHNSLSSHVEKANTQLGAASSADDLRLLWFRADNGLFVQDAREQIGTTLLGIRMVSAKRKGATRVRPCVYAGYADFSRYRAIDGAMIEVDGALTLIPNQFSPRQDAFACSPIYRTIAPAILDVRQGDRHDILYVIESDIDRKDDDALLAFLLDKYPADEFLGFVPYCAGTTVTTIDARRGNWDI